MSKYIVLYNFNKYYNRKIKRLASFADYEALITPGENTPAQFKGFKREFRNFDFSDGVYAKHVINIAKNEPLGYKTEQPDYFVLEESYTEGEGEEATTTTKVSRWFVLEAVRVRGNQYELSLRRDLLADYYNEVMTAPVFIQRGSPQVYYDPAIFNKEGFSFNQIKKSELLLNRNDLSGNQSGWVVGYINREDTPSEIKDCNVKQEINLVVPNYDDLPAKIKSLLNNGYGYLNEPLTARCAMPIKKLGNNQIGESGNYSYYDIGFNIGSNGRLVTSTLYSTTSRDGALPLFQYTEQGNLFEWDDILAYFREWFNYGGSIVTAFQAQITALSRSYDFDNAFLTSYQDTYYLKDGKYYKIHFATTGESDIYRKQYTGAQLTGSYDSLCSAIYDMIFYLYNSPNVIQNPNLNVNQYGISIERSMPKYSIIAEEVDNTTFQVTIPATRNQLLDAPYDMFVMPIGAMNVKLSGGTTFTTFLNTSIAAARGIAAKGTSSRILDVQILPYCPFPEVFDSNGDIDLTSATENKDYTIMKKTIGGVDTLLGVILYPLHSKGTFDYDVESLHITSNPDLTEKAFLTESLSGSLETLSKKVLSETRLVRFVSPNFASVYEMDPQKNGINGALKVNIDYYYKPYTPYIHVMPILADGLYGSDYNDPKGLICSGDFSLATASSKWEDYQVQNKNFQNQFDRQIQNLDVNNSIALEQAQITGGLGVITSGLSGLAAGALAGSAGGPVGAIVGGVVGAIGGTITSVIGYTKDLEHLRKSQSEARGYATDMYTYNLQNVQALPNTLNKVSAFTPNNKIFPFIEIYDCTEEEKQALRDKIKYNGMTIMRIGHIEDYINRNVTYYVQGELIRLEGIDEDSHVIAEIANEIKEGAYYYGSDTSES